jgi:hypothetical protein
VTALLLNTLKRSSVGSMVDQPTTSYAQVKEIHLGQRVSRAQPPGRRVTQHPAHRRRHHVCAAAAADAERSER